ncbi:MULTISPECIES: metallophosphoesterase [Listeria]|uniref:metallophosphoesterase n=1 Tax=Listeria TaxID=1637 RepID=UPI000B5975AA|nr:MULTISPECIES: metallophosphoesterase [Listeria]
MKKNIFGVAAFAGFMCHSYYATKKLVVTDYAIRSSKIPEAFDGKTYIQLSDVHSCSFGRFNHKLIKKVALMEPDGIFLTGDLIDGDEPQNVAIALVRKLKKICPLYYISGNHEQKSALFEDLLRSLKEEGVQILHNEHLFLEENGERIALAGVDDPTFHLPEEEKSSWAEHKFDMSGIVQEEIERATAKIPRDAFTILLAHRPEYWSIYQNMPVDLVLCGHAHGGQIRLPLTEGLFSPGQGFLPKLTAGCHLANGKAMIVSRGLGNTTIVPRILNNPEIVRLYLKREN